MISERTGRRLSRLEERPAVMCAGERGGLGDGWVEDGGWRWMWAQCVFDVYVEKMEGLDFGTRVRPSETRRGAQEGYVVGGRLGMVTVGVGSW